MSAVLAEQPVDTAALRKLAAVRGLVNHPLRQRVWPLLLGLQPVEDDDSSSYEEQSCQGHRDSQVGTLYANCTTATPVAAILKCCRFGTAAVCTST